MFAAEWFSSPVEGEFNPLVMQPYDWNESTIVCQKLGPTRGLWIKAGGDAEIDVDMVWGPQPEDVLHEQFRLFFNGQSIELTPRFIEFEGQRHSRSRDFSKSAQKRIADTEAAFGLEQLIVQADVAPMLWAHFALSALERWRRDADKCQESEMDVEAANARVVDLGLALGEMRKETRSTQVALDRDAMFETRAEYASVKRMAEKLSASAIENQAAAQTSKNMAVEAVTESTRRYPNFVLPLDAEDAAMMRNEGARYGY